MIGRTLSPDCNILSKLQSDWRFFDSVLARLTSWSIDLLINAIDITEFVYLPRQTLFLCPWLMPLF